MPRKCFLWIHVAKGLQVKCKKYRFALASIPVKRYLESVCIPWHVFFLSNLVITIFIMTRYHVWWDSYKSVWSVFHTLKSQHTRVFYEFFEKRGYDKICLFRILTNIWWPNVQLEGFFLLLFYCDWNTFSRVGPWGPILLKVFQSTCSQLNHSLGSEWNKHMVQNACEKTHHDYTNILGCQWPYYSNACEFNPEFNWQHGKSSLYCNIVALLCQYLNNLHKILRILNKQNNITQLELPGSHGKY